MPEIGRKTLTANHLIQLWVLFNQHALHEVRFIPQMNYKMDSEAIRMMEFLPNMINECTDLFLRVFTREPWNDHWESRQDARRYLESHYAFNSFLGYVVVLEKKIIGASFGFIKPWQQGLEYYINEFFIDTEIQREGIGTLLLNHIKGNILGKNMNAIILATERTFPAYDFYVKNGFREMDGTAFLGLSIKE